MHPLRGLGRVVLLIATIAALAATLPAASIAQDTHPQCSDGIDNDSDNAIDGADLGCGAGDDDDETDSPYSGIVIHTVALPVVTLQGTVDRHGVVNISRLLIRAQRGSAVDITCTGKRCPFKRVERRMLTTKLRLKKLERKMRPYLHLQVRISIPGQLGKYVSYKVRRNKAPLRRDECLDQTTGKVRGCFTG
ncbi:MAG: hypothetical protein QOI80_1271 [Solirubrobacteraceae bacterium]|jgi:hypothetical protein|nr:hypothetical protein [Solirubrobacteraceae bacterium]